MMARLYAVACPHGVITFHATADVPNRIAFAYGDADRLREVVTACARHAKGSDALLVPGLPEAPTQSAGIKALIAFADMVAARRGVRACN